MSTKNLVYVNFLAPISIRIQSYVCIFSIDKMSSIGYGGYNWRRLCFNYSCMHSCFQAKHEPNIVSLYNCIAVIWITAIQHLHFIQYWNMLTLTCIYNDLHSYRSLAVRSSNFTYSIIPYTFDIWNWNYEEISLEVFDILYDFKMILLCVMTAVLYA